MKRHILSNLKEWKNSPNRKPLILLGARQVGKTYILKQFGREEFDNMVYVNESKSAIFHHHILNNMLHEVAQRQFDSYFI